MANTRIALRRTSTAAKVPNSTHISTGELGLNLTDQLLYSMDAANSVFCIGNNLPTQHIGTNMFVGNGSVNVAINTTSLMVGDASGISVTSASIIVGNGSVNTFINSSAVLINGSPVGGGSPGGANTQIQFNDSSAFAGHANLTWNKTTALLSISGFTINSTGVAIGNGAGLTSVNAAFLGGTALADLQTEAGLASNVATLSSNNSSYLGTVAAASYQQTGAPLTNNVATLSSNNSSYLGGVVAASYINTSGAYIITGVHTYGNLTVNSVINSTAHAIGAANSTSIGAVLANSSLMIGNGSVNATINSTTFSGIALTANNATNLGGVTSGSYINTSGAYIITGVHTYGNLTINAIVNSTAMTIGVANSSASGLLANCSALMIGNGSVNVTINSTTFSGTSLTANNSTNLGGVTSGSYINTSGAYVITGVHTYGNLTVNSVINSTALSLGAINSTAIGTIFANSYLMIGNNTINATMNASTLSTSGPNFTIITTNTTATPLTVKGAASGTVNLFSVGNNTTASQFVINSTGYAVGNGAGLTSVSASVVANSGIVSNATGIFANLAATSGLQFSSGGLQIDVANGLYIDASGLNVLANTGVTVNSTGLFASGGSSVQLLDSISGSFNGSTTTFNTLVAAAPVVPTNVQSILVSLGGVLQTPTTAYTVSGNSITFSTAPATGDSCFMVLLGAAATSGVAGANTQVIFNDSGVYAGDVGLTYNKTTDILTVGNSTVNATLGVVSGLDIGNTTVNVSVNSLAITIGNSSINATMNSTTFSGTSLTANNASYLGGVTAAAIVSRSFDVLSPAQGDAYTLWHTHDAIVITEIITLISNTAGSSWANVTFYWGTTKATPVLMVSSNTANNTVGVHTTSFTNATVAANAYIWANLTTLTTVTEFHATVRFVP